MMEKISRFLTDYKIQKKRIDEQTSFGNTLKATLGAMLFSLAIFLIPGLLIYNLMIFNSLVIFLRVVIFILVILFAYTYFYLYVKLMQSYYERIEKLKFNNFIIIEGSISALILIVFTIVVMVLF